MDSTLVIKVKYGDTLRRFNGQVSKDGQLDLDMNGLREKILTLFNFPANADLALTYVDEDGDLLTLVNDDDLLDVTKQSLKFLKVNVQVNSDSSMPMRFNSVSKPARETLSKVSLDLASIATSSSCIVSELVDCFSKLGQLVPNSSQPSQSGNNKKETSRQSVVDTSKKPLEVVLSSGSNSSANSSGFDNKCLNGYIPVRNGLSVTTPLPFDDFSVGMFHSGVRCDGCGFHPIFGSRYKSKVIDDYHLCGICFAQIDNETDYTKISWLVSYRESLKCFRDSMKLDCRLVMDVNVLDGTVMDPSTNFTKIWRMRNCGNVPWPQGTCLVWIGGEKFSHEVSVGLEIPANGVPVDGEVDVGVDFTSPELPGQYVSFWMMESPSGTKFGQRVSVKIQVDAAKQESNPNGGLDLNLLPDQNAKCSQIIDLNEQPSMDSGLQESCNSAPPPVLEKLAGDVEKPEKAENFPINNSLFVGEVVSTARDVVSSSNDPEEKSRVEELEQMGFNEEEIDLCSFTEWDPILDELQEMGFCDGNKNKELLQKNSGSISRVVMDLLTGERA